MLLAITARRLLIPVFVVAVLSLPVVSAPPHATPYAGDPVIAVDEGPTRGVVRSALSDAVPALLVAPVSGPATFDARVSVPSRAVTATAPRPRARTSRADRGEFRPGWESRRGEIALSLISYPWRDLGWEISFHEGRPGLLGLAHEPEKHIYVFVRRGQSIRALAFTIAHEIGHAYDFTFSTRDSHNRWKELRGIGREVAWAGCNGCSDLETPAGDFAEVFAVWQVGPADYRSRMAPVPSGERLRILAQEFLPTGPSAST